MCKQRTSTPAPRDLPFEGETIRLDGRLRVPHYEQAVPQQSRRKAHCQMHWWPLWMIWPLFGLIKWLAPALVAAGTTLGQAILSVPLLVPIVLIIAGIVLLRRA